MKPETSALLGQQVGNIRVVGVPGLRCVHTPYGATPDQAEVSPDSKPSAIGRATQIVVAREGSSRITKCANLVPI